MSRQLFSLVGLLAINLTSIIEARFSETQNMEILQVLYNVQSYDLFGSAAAIFLVFTERFTSLPTCIALELSDKRLNVQHRRREVFKWYSQNDLIPS